MTSAFDPDLETAKEEIAERLAQHKREARQAGEKVAAHIASDEHLSAERKETIRSLVENLDREITMIESASHETLATSRRQLGDQVRKLKAEWDATLKSAQSHSSGLLHESVAASARALEKLESELKIAEDHLASIFKKK